MPTGIAELAGAAVLAGGGIDVILMKAVASLAFSFGPSVHVAKAPADAADPDCRS